MAAAKKMVTDQRNPDSRRCQQVFGQIIFLSSCGFDCRRWLRAGRGFSARVPFGLPQKQSLNTDLDDQAHRLHREKTIGKALKPRSRRGGIASSMDGKPKIFP
jgi:hypothetical protein